MKTIRFPFFNSLYLYFWVINRVFGVCFSHLKSCTIDVNLEMKLNYLIFDLFILRIMDEAVHAVTINSTVCSFFDENVKTNLLWNEKYVKCTEIHKKS